MNVLHYSLSLSACPKCHLFICKHTSLADLDFNVTQEEIESITDCHSNQIPRENHIENSIEELSLHGTNIYIFPPTTNGNTHYSWTTFGTDSIDSTNTCDNSSSNNETICENVPFANESVINSLLPSTSILNQIVRTQSEKFDKKLQQSIYLTKSFSLSTLCNKSFLFPSEKKDNHSITKSYSYSNKLLIIIIILLLTFLITNTIDIVLIYIYYHANYVYFISFISTIILCDIILWINNLMQLNTLPSFLLLIPFMIRPYLLYQLVELLTILFDKKAHNQILDSSPSSSTTSTTTRTTLDTNLSSNGTSPTILHPLSSFKIKKRTLFRQLTLFYLVQTGFVTLINIFFWSHNFQQSTKSLLNMNYFIPRFISNNKYLSSTSTINTKTSYSTIDRLRLYDNERQRFTHRSILSGWPQFLFSSSIPISVHLSSLSTFIFISISYYLLINNSLLLTFLILKRFSFGVILSILSRFCLIITRIYAIIFLFRLETCWLSIGFFLIHLTLIITQLFYRSKFKHQRHTIFLQTIFSFITHYSIDDISINAMISLENLAVFIYRLFLETFSFNYSETTLRLIIFISTLMSLQIVGFTFDILSKTILYRTKAISFLQKQTSSCQKGVC